MDIETAEREEPKLDEKTLKFEREKEQVKTVKDFNLGSLNKEFNKREDKKFNKSISEMRRQYSK